MTVKEEIDAIVERRFGNYRGDVYRRLDLERIHRLIRALRGDEAFLDFLKKGEINNPTIGEYKIPDHMKKMIDKSK